MRRPSVVGSLVIVMGLALALTCGGMAQALADAQADKKPARQMNTKLHQHPLQLRVRVLGDYARAPTFLEKRTCATCVWRVVDRKKTDPNGRVLYPLDAPPTGNWYYRVGTPERPNFRESYSRVARTFRH